MMISIYSLSTGHSSESLSIHNSHSRLTENMNCKSIKSPVWNLRDSDCFKWHSSVVDALDRHQTSFSAVRSCRQARAKGFESRTRVADGFRRLQVEAGSPRLWMKVDGNGWSWSKGSSCRELLSFFFMTAEVETGYPLSQYRGKAIDILFMFLKALKNTFVKIQQQCALSKNSPVTPKDSSAWTLIIESARCKSKSNIFGGIFESRWQRGRLEPWRDREEWCAAQVLSQNRTKDIVIILPESNI